MNSKKRHILFWVRKTGQSTVEYSVLVIIVLGALLATQSYVKRALQGRYKDAADEIGDQYSPGNSNYSRLTRSKSNKTEFREWRPEPDPAGFGIIFVLHDGASLRTDEITRVDTLLEIVNVQQEYWGRNL